MTPVDLLGCNHHCKLFITVGFQIDSDIVAGAVRNAERLQNSPIGLSVSLDGCIGVTHGPELQLRFEVLCIAWIRDERVAVLGPGCDLLW